MKELDFNNDWSFKLNDGEYYSVNLPHDFSICQDRTPTCKSGANTGWYNGGIGKYVKKFEVAAQDVTKTHLFVVEGCYGITEVYLNRNLITIHPNGYTEFICDLTPYLKAGLNKLVVKVSNNHEPNARWYSGSGLYRPVHLYVDDNGGYIHPWGIYARTSGKTLSVDVSAENGIDSITATLFYHGKQVAYAEGKPNQTIELSDENAVFWSPDNPKLYDLNVKAYREGKLCDERNIRIGFRDITLSHEEGMLINGQPIKLRGGCIHHDNGILGACAYREAEWRKIAILKELGYNAVRLAHNTFSREILNACDELGMLVLCETFDCWREGKDDYDYHIFFEKYWEEDLYSMVLRDRSRTCIFMWVTGNEVGERGGSSNGGEISGRLAEFIRRYDKRPITNAINLPSAFDADNMNIITNILSAGGNIDISTIPRDVLEEMQAAGRMKADFEKIIEPVTKHLDVVGYNYFEAKYEDAQNIPNLVVVGTEAHPTKMCECRRMVEKVPCVIGDFTWVAFDYMGESGVGKAHYDEQPSMFAPYPFHTAFDGDVDICGFLRPQGACRRILWGDNNPSVWVLPPELTAKKEVLGFWSWPYVERNWNFGGGKVRVDVYSNADEVELFINGVSQGRAKPEDLVAHFYAEYSEGEVRAVNYRNGEPMEEDYLETVGEPKEYLLKKLPSRSPSPDIDYYEVTAVDDKKRCVPHDGTQLNVISDGFIGCGTGNPLSEDNYTLPDLTLWCGKGLIAVRHGASVRLERR